MKVSLFLAVGTLLGGLVATLLGLRGGASWGEALILGLPLGCAQAALCFAARFPARAVPLGAGTFLRAGGTHLTAAAVTSLAWVLLGAGFARLLERLPAYAGAAARFNREAVTLGAAGMLIFLLAVTTHYLVIALDAAREAEVRGVRANALAREAELRALRAQVDPHFLFNSLNSIATLTGEDPAAARRMCLLLGGFLRRSLELGQRESITLGDELGLVGDYLAIEKNRFGPRLEVAEEVEDGCRACPVPPLLLQPLVENAVRHGIAQRLEGGTIRIDARRGAGGVTVTVDNPRDPEKPTRRGAGVGLENVRGRLLARHGAAARLDVESSADAYRVRVLIPWGGGRGPDGPSD